MKFEIQPKTLVPVAVATLTGRFDASNCRQFREAFDQTVKKTDHFVVDCHALDFIDSSGLGTLVYCLGRVLKSGGDIKLAGIAAKARMVFELTQAEKLFSFFSDVDQAVDSFSGRNA